MAHNSWRQLDNLNKNTAASRIHAAYVGHLQANRAHRHVCIFGHFRSGSSITASYFIQYFTQGPGVSPFNAALSCVWLLVCVRVGIVAFLFCFLFLNIYCGGQGRHFGRAAELLSMMEEHTGFWGQL